MSLRRYENGTKRSLPILWVVSLFYKIYCRRKWEVTKTSVLKLGLNLLYYIIIRILYYGLTPTSTLYIRALRFYYVCGKHTGYTTDLFLGRVEKLHYLNRTFSECLISLVGIDWYRILWKFTLLLIKSPFLRTKGSIQHPNIETVGGWVGLIVCLCLLGITGDLHRSRVRDSIIIERERYLVNLTLGSSLRTVT